MRDSNSRVARVARLARSLRLMIEAELPGDNNISASMALLKGNATSNNDGCSGSPICGDLVNVD